MQRAGTDSRPGVTVAILGDNPVICDAIAHLVETGDYATRIVDVDLEQKIPADADVVLVTPGSTTRGRMPPLPAGTLMLELVDLPREKGARESLESRGIPWPCTVEELQRGIRSALEPGASRSVGGRYIHSRQFPGPAVDG